MENIENIFDNATAEFFEKVQKKYGSKYKLLSRFIDNYNKINILDTKNKKSYWVDPKFFLSDKFKLQSKTKKINKTFLKTERAKTVYYLKIKHKESSFEFVGISNYDIFHDDFIIESEIIDSDKINLTGLKKFTLPSYIYLDLNEVYYYENYQLKSSHVKFVRDSILEYQSGICSICENDVVLPTLDHYHKKRQDGNGLVRGVICNTCNRMIGCIENNLARNSIYYSDSPDVLRNIANYLQNSRWYMIHPTEKVKEKELKKSSYNKLKKIIGTKQKIPAYSSKLNKQLKKLYEKYGLEPEFKK